MTEDAKLDEAISRADEMLMASLRREEAERGRRAVWMWGAMALVVGVLVGGGVMWGVLNSGRKAVVPEGVATTMTAPGTMPVDPKGRVFTEAGVKEEGGYIYVTEAIPTKGELEVKWGTTWRRASIVRREGNLFQIRYVGWSEHFDEWVGIDRMRPVGSERDDKEYARPRSASTQRGGG